MDQMIQEITLLFGSALTICVALTAFARKFDLRAAENEISNHCFFYGCHFILHPTLKENFKVRISHTICNLVIP